MRRLFSEEERERVTAALLARAMSDAAITGAAFTGSHSLGQADRWSDIDLVIGVRGDPLRVAGEWRRWICEEFGARHDWDLPAGRRVVRVFLLPRWLEVDLTFAPEDEFGARGPQWRTVFGVPRRLEPFPPPDRRHLTGLVWHHARHAHVSIERGLWWQAEHWISALRDHVIGLACLRLGHPPHYAKGAHLLPASVMQALEAALVRSLDAVELRRALLAAVDAAADEVGRSDPEVAAMFRELPLR